jgi:transcriptional regulator with XRE-family HTH domain
MSRAGPEDLALGQAIRARRRAAGMSQDELADRCGVSFQQMQKYERGLNRVSVSRLVHIAHALGCRVGELAGPLDGGPSDGDLAVLVNRARELGALDLLGHFLALPPPARQSLLRFLAARLGGPAEPTLNDDPPQPGSSASR